MKSAGRGVLHHGKAGGASGGWCSDVTDEKMRDVLTEAGLEVVDQFRAWTDPDGTEYQAGRYDDAVTVFRKG